MSVPAYDRMGIDYSQVRRADPRIEATIWSALGEARSVVNVGAGAGSYEPPDREVIAVEPSPVMIAQRPAGAATAIEGLAEALPLEDDSVDAAMGVFTMQHWQDVDRGLEDLPEMVEHDRRAFPSMTQLDSTLPAPQVETVPVPSDCADGFCVALWSRPEAQLDPGVRQASSIWHRLPTDVADRALACLRAELP